MNSMDLKKLTKLLEKPVIINSLRVYTEKTKVMECIQGTLKEINANSIVIEQCFTDQDYLDNAKHTTTREFTDNQFILIAPVTAY